MQAPGDVYRKFLETHGQAVALGGLRPELRCNRGHGLHLFEQQLEPAEAELLAAIAEKPSYGATYVRAALLYVTMNRLDDAAAMLEQCALKDPLVPTLPATALLLRFWRRDFDAAIAYGKQAIELHPYLQIVRVNYAQALEFSERLPEALAQYKLASVMSPDLPWLRALEGTCYAKMGRAAEAREILDELEHLRRSEYVDAFYHVRAARSARPPRRGAQRARAGRRRELGVPLLDERRPEDGRLARRPAVSAARSRTVAQKRPRLSRGASTV